jgi:hypothetical protein
MIPSYPILISIPDIHLLYDIIIYDHFDYLSKIYTHLISMSPSVDNNYKNLYFEPKNCMINIHSTAYLSIVMHEHLIKQVN